MTMIEFEISVLISIKDQIRVRMLTMRLILQANIHAAIILQNAIPILRIANVAWLTCKKHLKKMKKG